MLELLIAMLLFTAVVVALAAVVLAARRALMPEGTVTIDINSQRTIEAETGDTLLRSLANADIALPAACGGRGSCGQCRVRVLSGGGALLPAEQNHLRQRDVTAGLRLACMVTLREDLAVELPPDILAARPWTGTLESSRFLAPLLVELTLAPPAGRRPDYRPGDYVLMEAPAGRVDLADVAVPEAFAGDWAALRALWVESPEPTLRAYSLASYPGEAETIKLVIRLALPPPNAPEDAPPGRVSSWAFTLRPDQDVPLSGPFGTFHLRDTDREKVFIGGGAGIAPMRAMILDLLSRGAPMPVSFWYGARSLRELCYRDEFTELARRHANFRYCAALSQPEGKGWSGPTGFIHRVLREQYLAAHAAPEEAEYYLCGPPVMARAVITMLEDLGVDRDNILLDDFGG